jgi:hypothetical protein
MILTEQQIKDYIESPQNGELLAHARQVSDELRMYITGDGLLEHIVEMPYFINTDLEAIRKAITRSTKDLTGRVLKPLDKVFTALGGARYYNLSATKEAEFDDIINKNVRNGMGMPEWMHNTALWAKLLDPMSLLYDELDENGKAYPTYKSTKSIHDYILNGTQPEYVILKLSTKEVGVLVQAGLLTEIPKEGNVFRIVDDAFEYYYHYAGGKSKELARLGNFFKRVPAHLSSDNVKFDSDYHYSECEVILELLKDYFNDNSSKALFKKFAMYPREWGIGAKCQTCDGTKTFKGEKCPTCKGSGWHTSTSVAQKQIVGVDEDGNAKIPTPPGGWYGVGKESWEMMNEELDKLTADVSDTFWGTSKIRRMQNSSVNDTNMSTATGEVIMERGKEPMLNKFSKWAEKVDKFHTDNIKRAMHGLDAEDSTIVYGRRYVTGTKEENIDIYIYQKNNNITSTLLNDTIAGIYEATYSSNPVELEARKKILYVEPYPHNTINEVLSWNLPDSVKNAKLYFPLWYNTITDLQVIIADEQALRDSLQSFADEMASKAPKIDEQQKQVEKQIN